MFYFYPQKAHRQNQPEARSDIRSLPLDPTTPPRSTGGGGWTAQPSYLGKSCHFILSPPSDPPPHHHEQRPAAGSFNLPTRAKVALFLARWPDHRKGSRPPGGLGISRVLPRDALRFQSRGRLAGRVPSACCRLPAPGSLLRPHLPDREKHPQPQQSLAGPRRTGSRAPAAGWGSTEILSGSADPSGSAASTTRHPIIKAQEQGHRPAPGSRL